jgi:hypothetical protein
MIYIVDDKAKKLLIFNKDLKKFKILEKFYKAKKYTIEYYKGELGGNRTLFIKDSNIDIFNNKTWVLDNDVFKDVTIQSSIIQVK